MNEEVKGKKSPQLRFSGFDDEWEEKSFSDITYISATKNKNNLPLESYSITNENGFIPQDEQFENGGTMKDADKRMYWIVPPRSFGYNPARINVGSIGYYDGKKDVIVSSLYEIFKMTENCDDAFFWQWFKSDNLQKQVLKLQEGGVRLYFYYDKLCMGEIKIPSKGEQQKIGTFLSHVDSLIQAKTKKLESLKAVKKSLLQKCFPKAGEKVPEMRFAGFSGDWEEKKLGEIAVFSKGHGYSKNDLIPDGDPIILYGRMYTNYETIISNIETFVHKQENSVLSKGGEIIIPAFGETAEDIARASVVKKAGIILGGDINIISLPKSVYDSSFVALSVSHGESQKELCQNAQGKTIVHLHNDDIRKISIMFPSLDEQQKIGQFFSKYDSLISAQQKEIDKLKDIKKSLLQKMFI